MVSTVNWEWVVVDATFSIDLEIEKKEMVI